MKMIADQKRRIRGNGGILEIFQPPQFKGTLIQI